MSREPKKTAVPKLRFPEFKKSRDWEKISLGSCLKDKPSYGANASAIPFRPTLPRYIRITDIDDNSSLKNENPVSIELVEGKEYLLEDGDFLIARSGNTVGKSLLYKSKMGKCAYAGYLLKFKFDEKKTTSDFFQFVVQSDFYWNWVKSSLRAGGQPNINAQEYSSFEFMLPPKKEEQEKFIRCLSSLDKVIIAQSEKVEALKKYKKGLLQQLFPQDGETSPRLRFPEFKKSDPWQKVPLDKLADKVTLKNMKFSEKRVLTNSAVDGVVDQRDFFDKDIANKANLDGYYIIEKGDFVYNPRISNLAPVGPIARNELGVGVMSPLYTIFRFKENYTDFYAHYFKSNHWHSYIRSISNSGARHDRITISNDELMAMPVFIPQPKEQQKIADFLSSFDEVIAAENDRLESLKFHKKGLLQQLFPSLTEDENE